MDENNANIFLKIFISLFNAYKTNKIAFFSFVVLIMITSMFSYAFYIILNDRDKIYTILLENNEAIHEIKNDHESVMLKTSVLEPQINSELAHLMDTVSAARAYVFLFHNGKSSLNGISFIKMSNTNEVTQNGVSKEINNLQDVSIREIITWIPYFLKKECVYQVIDEIENATLRTLLQDQGIKNLITCPLFDKDRSEPIGFAGVDFLGAYKAGENRGEQEKEVELSSRVISIILEGYKMNNILK